MPMHATSLLPGHASGACAAAACMHDVEGTLRCRVAVLPAHSRLRSPVNCTATVEAPTGPGALVQARTVMHHGPHLLRVLADAMRAAACLA